MMRVRITIPGISGVEIRVSRPYAPDLLDDMTTRAMIATANAAAAYRTAVVPEDIEEDVV